MRAPAERVPGFLVEVGRCLQNLRRFPPALQERVCRAKGQRLDVGVPFYNPLRLRREGIEEADVVMLEMGVGFHPPTEAFDRPDGGVPKRRIAESPVFEYILILAPVPLRPVVIAIL